jgi:lysophospholipase L1-like esterase
VSRDVFAQKGVRWMILFAGVNDIGSIRDSGTQETRTRQLIAAYEKLIADAHARKIRVYGCTITPFKGNGYYREESEAARKSVNDWIRTSGKFDAVIDMDALTRDPDDPARLRKAYDSGDGLHLNPDGYRAMGESVDLGLFR